MKRKAFMQAKAKVQTADERKGPLPAERHHLAEDNVALAYHAAKLFAGKAVAAGIIEREEVEGNAVLWLVKAARDFDPGKGFKFTTYAMRVLFNAISHHVTLAARPSRRPVNGFMDTPDSWMEETLAAREEEESPWDPEALKLILRRLRRTEAGKRHARVLKMRYLEGRTCKEIGLAIGVTKQSASVITRKALRAARDAWERRGRRRRCRA